METPLAETEATAELIKKHFNQLKSEQIGKKYNPHARFRKYELWIAAAEVCNDLEAGPYDFVRAAFLYCNIPGGPYPQNLCTNAVRIWYSEYKKLAPQTDGMAVGDIYKVEIGTLVRNAYRMLNMAKRTPRDFLLDVYGTPTHIVPAYIRVLMLPKDAAVRQKFGSEARAEIIGNRQLLRVLTAMGFDLTWLEK